MNNLDPDVAERPDDLVVYGGTGRAARSWEAFDAIVRTLRDARGRRDAARAVGQAGRRVPHARVGAARADRQLQPRARVGDLGRVPPARGPRADDVRPDDRRVVDLHRHPGHPAGHLRELRGDRAAALRRLAGRDDHADRRARRHGRRAAAGGDDERRRGAVRRGRPRSGSSGGSRRATSTSRPTTSTTRSRAAARRKRRAAARCRVGLLGNAAEVLPRAARARASRPTSSPTRRARTTRSAATCPDRPDARGGRPSCARDDPDEYVRRARAAMAAHCAAMVGFQDRGAEVFDYGNNLRAEAQARRLRARVRLPRASCPPTSGRCSARARARSAGSRSRATRPTSPRPTAPCSRCSPTTSASRAGSSMAGERVAFQGLPARICWLGYGERHRLGLRFNEMVRARRGAGADRDRPRPPRLRLGRLALPRDRGDGRRVRRDRRLAAAERAGQHRRRARRGCSIHHGGGVGIGRSIHAGHGRASPTAPTSRREKLERVLTADPGMGVIRHADAGYDRAVEVAEERGVRIPMREVSVTSARSSRSGIRCCASGRAR